MRKALLLIAPDVMRQHLFDTPWTMRRLIVDSFDLNVLKTPSGKSLAHKIVRNEFGPDNEWRVAFDAVIENPSLLESREGLFLGTPDHFLDVMGRAPFNLSDQFSSIRRQLWRFGEMGHSFLRHGAPVEKDVERIPYKLMGDSVEDAYKRLGASGDFVVIDTGDDLVRRIIQVFDEALSIAESKPAPEAWLRAPGLSNGVVDMDNGRVILRGPKHNWDSTEFRRKIFDAFDGSFPHTNFFLVNHDYEKQKTEVDIFGADPAFDLFEPFATLVEGNSLNTIMHVSPKRRAAGTPLLFRFEGGFEKSWSGIPEGTKKLWRTETKVPDNYDKDATFGQMLLHGVRLQSTSAKPTDVFIQGASNVYRIDPNGPHFIWDHLPKNEISPGMPVGFLATGPAAQSMVSAMWMHCRPL